MRFGLMPEFPFMFLVGPRSQLHALYTVLTSPFDEHSDLAHYGFDQKRPESACDFMLSCSS